ncbi:AraC family transcriptional regulator [Pleionea sp. CnH1-48]|uniref:helix-turn-helix transcriptional regulator n=1 Tax=Pleionea sp. CnH1-48 TaxID=2954494 RepID=UPI002097FF38|nr:AraC family transcriptional regulator [Pleionea sp. CnH1-48]MCO7223874.1 AraC family transcriptional regulator [Pleionea sp. CnH1-48]
MTTLYNGQLRTIKLKYARSCIEFVLSEYLVPVEHLLRCTNIKYSAIHNDDYLISSDDFIQLCQNAIELTNNPHLGLLIGNRLNICSLKELGYALISSEDLWSTLEFVLDEINKEFLAFQFEQSLHTDKGVVYLDVMPETQAIEQFIVETLFSFAFNLTRYLKVPHSDKIEYHFAFDANDDYPYEMLFPNVRTSSGRNYIVLPQEALHTASPLADKNTFHSARQVRLRMNEHEHCNSLEEKIKNILLNAEYELPTLDMVAEQLFSTPWTISRKLKKSGTSFQALVDEVRINKASHLLAHSKVNVSDISQMLGYSDVSSFRRAFRRWFGVSPREYRDSKRSSTSNEALV